MKHCIRMFLDPHALHLVFNRNTVFIIIVYSLAAWSSGIVSARVQTMGW
jgi:hypothetical protein